MDVANHVGEADHMVGVDLVGVAALAVAAGRTAEVDHVGEVTHGAVVHRGIEVHLGDVIEVTRGGDIDLARMKGEKSKGDRLQLGIDPDPGKSCPYSFVEFYSLVH